MAAEELSPGLEGVVAGRSDICDIEEDRGGLLYRGYPIEELAEGATFEEVAYLLLMGRLPTAWELSEFAKQISVARELPAELIQVLRGFPRSAHPMDVFRTAISYLGAVDPDRSDSSQAGNLRKSIRLIAQAPMVMTAHHRIVHGKAVIEPDPRLSQGQQILYLLTGELPDQSAARALDVSLILYAEHEFNASTFSARVTASSLSDIHSAIVAAIGSLKGPLHGGANEAVMHMLLEIKETDRAAGWLEERLRRKERIMGFGHRVLKRGDTRSIVIKRHAKELGERMCQKKWFQISELLEGLMLEKKGLYPNLDFYTASTYYLMGVPIPLYTPVFASSRMAGWCAHVIEQHEHNRLIRPRCLYTGPRRRPFVPLSRRGGQAE
jgi:2-methylcitrate synthase/citrate synthase II